ncbi:hypothetical protein LCGC14_0283710 [marine sediment metagenome]|uniref:Uncharacterized protein n=1 Tax=marine sediment metagenome TaxID=412755 RepID=A0A0F9UC94_9ZZZZ
MAHLTARFNIRLTVKMQRRVALFGQLGHAVHVIANQVLHHHIGIAAAIAQRPSGHGTDMLFELVHRTAVLRPMTRVMDPWRDLVHDESLSRDEKLDPKNTDIIERIQYLGGKKYRVHALRCAQPGWHSGGVQDAVAVHIFARIETGNLARGAARGNDRHFGGEVHEPFEHGGW